MICLDTSVLIWGIQGVSRSGQEPMIERTRAYLRYLRDEQELLMIPAPVLAEYLSGVAPEQADAEGVVLEKRFYIPAFDARAAVLAAELQRATPIGEVRAISSEDRQSLKTDYQIVAVAIAHGARMIVTHNVAEYQRIAGNRITIIDVPEILGQLTLEEPS